MSDFNCNHGFYGMLCHRKFQSGVYDQNTNTAPLYIMLGCSQACRHTVLQVNIQGFLCLKEKKKAVKKKQGIKKDWKDSQ